MTAVSITCCKFSSSTGVQPSSRTDVWICMQQTHRHVRLGRGALDQAIQDNTPAAGGTFESAIAVVQRRGPSSSPAAAISRRAASTRRCRHRALLRRPERLDIALTKRSGEPLIVSGILTEGLFGAESAGDHEQVARVEVVDLGKSCRVRGRGHGRYQGGHDSDTCHALSVSLSSPVDSSQFAPDP